MSTVTRDWSDSWTLQSRENGIELSEERYFFRGLRGKGKVHWVLNGFGTRHPVILKNMREDLLW